ncbi:minor capsid protein [Aerococcus urinae]|uniref:minor capsid protein n=1 Tax=Aerococcus urinae TaxID=1376 RepID=UPI00254AB940|nr:minor capsid protein [Aerococcus urinae]MDK6688319.1 minor capsid protein [Aerococcus urinae]
MKITNQELKQYLYNKQRREDDKLFKRTKSREQLQKQLFDDTLRDIQKRIDEFYLRYAKREGITLAEAKKRADEMDIRAYQERAKKAVKEKDFSKETEEWLRVYNLKMKVSRLEVMKAEINLDLLELFDQVEKETKKAFWEEALREAESQSGILRRRKGLTREELDQIIDADFYGNNFSERIWGRNGKYETLRDEIFRELRGMRTGWEGYRGMAQNLKQCFDTSLYEAYRLARTEERRILTRTRIESYKKAGYTHLIYITESHPCKLCASYSGEMIPIEDAIEGVNIPPKHPNCRCHVQGWNAMTLNGKELTMDGWIEHYMDEGLPPMLEED